jgi:predicted RNase H-like nuclease
MWVGVDGCKLGWLGIAILADGSWRFDVDRTAHELWERWSGAELILLDIPIGLVNTGEERTCDREARKTIGPRRSSVFPAPSRATLSETTYGEGSAANRNATGRGLSQQSWAIVPKIREVDGLLRGSVAARRKIREVHPELLFWGLNNGSTLAHPKKQSVGYDERLAILSRHFPSAPVLAREVLSAFRRKDVAADDVLDATAAAVTGWLARGKLVSIPALMVADSVGLPMEMVYWTSEMPAAH